jgi:hypothetical protein
VDYFLDIKMKKGKIKMSKKNLYPINNNFLAKLLLLQLMIGAMAIPEVRASGRMSDRMAIHEGETATQFSARVKRAEENEAHSQNMAKINTALIQNAQETHNTTRSFLNSNRVMWYSIFAGVGSGLALSNLVEDSSAAVLGGFGAGGFVLGGIVGCAAKTFCAGGAEYFQNSRVLNVVGGLASLVPWVIFGATHESKKSE